MTKDELNELSASVAPVRLLLTKVIFCLIMKAASQVIFPFPEHYILFQIVWHGMTAVPKNFISRDWWDV